MPSNICENACFVWQRPMDKTSQRLPLLPHSDPKRRRAAHIPGHSSVPGAGRANKVVGSRITARSLRISMPCNRGHAFPPAAQVPPRRHVRAQLAPRGPLPGHTISSAPAAGRAVRRGRGRDADPRVPSPPRFPLDAGRNSSGRFLGILTPGNLRNLRGAGEIFAVAHAAEAESEAGSEFDLCETALRGRDAGSKPCHIRGSPFCRGRRPHAGVASRSRTPSA